jgi:1-acyl-sn-glycerol-3-phosphate acyltransferase
MNIILRILLEIVRAPILAIWYLQGWRVEVPPPADLDQYIVIAVPHTSYWDYYHMMMMALQMRRRPRTTTKHTLFRFPIGSILRALGCIPINREQALHAVDWMADLFKKEKRLVLVITVEGTRQKTRFWKSGFYYVALKANVPIVCGYIDYVRKRTGAEMVIHPSGDIHADFERLRDYYMRYGRNGKYPDQVSDLALKEHKLDRMVANGTSEAESEEM